MFIGKYLAGAGLAFALVFAWKYHQSGEFNQLLKPKAPASTIKFDNDPAPGAGMTSSDEPPQQIARKAGSGIHKCKVGDSVIYTDAPCDKPGYEQAIGKGSVTVVKGQKPVTSPAADASSGLPNARSLLGKPMDQSILDKHIERQINP